MSLQHYKSQLNKVSRHLIGNSVPPNIILIPFSLSSAQQKIGYHYWLLMQGSLLIEKGLKYYAGVHWHKGWIQILSSLDCQLSSLSWKTKISIMKKYRKKAELLPFVFHWILERSETGYSLIMKRQCVARKKAFLFHFFPDSARYGFPSRSFHAETQKVFDLHATLSPGQVRWPVWRRSSAKTVISSLKGFHTTVWLYELILLWHLL